MNYCKLALLYVAVVVTSASCQSAGSKPCTDYAIGPRRTSFGLATLPETPRLGGGTGAIIGSVADSETGRGINRATVILRADRASRVLSYVIADSLGGFVFEQVRPGRYFLSANGMTYGERRVPVEATLGRVDTVQIQLRFNPRYLSCDVITTT
jgi:hypothetical protein